MEGWSQWWLHFKNSKNLENYQITKKYPNLKGLSYRDEGKCSQKRGSTVGIPVPFCTMIQFIIYVYCFQEGHNVIMKFLDTTMTVFKKNNIMLQQWMFSVGNFLMMHLSSQAIMLLMLLQNYTLMIGLRTKAKEIFTK